MSVSRSGDSSSPLMPSRISYGRSRFHHVHPVDPERECEDRLVSHGPQDAAPVEPDSYPPGAGLDQELLRRKVEADPASAEQEGSAGVDGEFLQGGPRLGNRGGGADTLARLVHGLVDEAAHLKVAGAGRDDRVARTGENHEPHDAVDVRPYSHAFPEAFMRCHTLSPRHATRQGRGLSVVGWLAIWALGQVASQTNSALASGCALS